LSQLQVFGKAQWHTNPEESLKIVQKRPVSAPALREKNFDEGAQVRMSPILRRKKLVSKGCWKKKACLCSRGGTLCRASKNSIDALHLEGDTRSSVGS